MKTNYSNFEIMMQLQEWGYTTKDYNKAYGFDFIIETIENPIKYNIRFAGIGMNHPKSKRVCSVEIVTNKKIYPDKCLYFNWGTKKDIKNAILQLKKDNDLL